MTRIVFMGTPAFAVPTLQALIAHYEVIGVVTQPDRPAGRKQQLRQSPIKQLALQYDIPVFQPEKLRNPMAIEQLRAWEPDLQIVAAYGQILPQTVLDIPRYGSLNVHASILPRWRGAAPIHAAIRHGDSETGITIMHMDAGLDTGDIYTQQSILITSDETGQSLHDKLSLLGGELLIASLPGILSGETSRIPQDESFITYAPQIKKQEGEINWNEPAINIERLVRAFTPWPGTYTIWNGKQLKILAGTVVDGSIPSGDIRKLGDTIVIGTGDTAYAPTIVQLAGKKQLPIAEFVRGYPDFIRSTLGSDATE